MKMIRLKNMIKRAQVFELDKTSNAKEQQIKRSKRNHASGQIETKIATYKTFDTFTLLAGSTSEPMPEQVTQNTSVKEAIAQKKVKVLPA